MVPISYNLRSLAVRKTTTIATALGIGLVVFVLASTMMLTNGIKKTLASSGSRQNAIVLRKGADAELPSSIDEPAVRLITTATGVKRDPGGNPLAVAETVVVILMNKSNDSGMSNVQVRGVPANAVSFRSEIHVVAGRPPQPGTDEVMIGKRIEGRFHGLAVGKSFDLKKNRPVQVVGVFEADGSSFESEVWADLDTVRSSFGREGQVSSVTVRLESPASFDNFETAIEQDKQLLLEAKREDKFYEEQSEGTATFYAAMGGVIAFFFSFGAIIGAVITMLGAVSARRREIATLRALGFSRGGILLSFIIEALALSLLGAVIGVLAALGMGFVKFSTMNFATWSEIVFSFTPTPGIMAAAVIAAVVMGLLGGLWPAISAALTAPAQAMRE